MNQDRIDSMVIKSWEAKAPQAVSPAAYSKTKKKTTEAGEQGRAAAEKWCRDSARAER